MVKNITFPNAECTSQTQPAARAGRDTDEMCELEGDICCTSSLLWAAAGGYNSLPCPQGGFYLVCGSQRFYGFVKDFMS